MDSTGPVRPPRPLLIAGCQTPAELRFAFLNLRGHPRGELMLHRLGSAGFVPVAVIDEDSPLADTGRRAQLAQLRQVQGFQPAPDTRRFCADRGLPHHVVPNHNDPRVVDLIRHYDADLVVLGDTRILRPQVITSVPHGIVNTHPGVLPEVRGNNPYIWAVIHDLPQGATVHLIDSRVDRGPVLSSRRVTLAPGGGIPQLIQLMNELCADLVVDVARQIVAGTAVATAQPEDSRLTFRAARPEIWDAAAVILRERSAMP